MNSQQKSPEPDVPGYLNQGITDLPGTVPDPKVKSVKPIDCHRYRHYYLKQQKPPTQRRGSPEGFCNQNIYIRQTPQNQ